MAKPTFARFILILRLLFLTFGPWLLHLLVADILLSALLPLACLFPTYTYHRASAIAESVWRGIQRICVDMNGAAIIISGDELPRGESAIVVANHIEWSDFYLIQALAIKANMLGRCRWFAKRQLKWVPFLGWGLWVMGMPLVSRNWTEDQKEMDHLFSGINKGVWPTWLISFSEATRFSTKKYTETVQWCEANGKPIPKHTLFPRTKGFVASVQQLRKSHVKAVYDTTIAYADGNTFMSPPTFFETIYQPCLAQRYRFYIHVDRYELDALPHTDAEIAHWLEERWMAKGERLALLKKQLATGISWRSERGRY